MALHSLSAVMPTYEYQCPKCGTFEVYQSIKDEALKACPTCRSKKVARIVTGGAGVIFTGAGFWETDYNRSKDYTSKKKAESVAPAAPAAPATPAAAKTPAKAEAKPAAAPSVTKPPPAG